MSSILYNRFGRRIVQVGLKKGTISPIEYGDVYEEPVDRLDYVLKKSFEFGGSIKFTATNLINPKVNYTQKIDGEEYTKESYRKGRSFSLSYSQKI
jgi:hypothetical protein